MRQVLWGVVILGIAVGCGVLPATITQPTNMSLVVGGLTDTNPFFGNFKLANTADEGKGIFLLASCGCGDWRVLFRSDDGLSQRQYPVKFYTEGEYLPTGLVTFYGDNNGEQIIGTIDQDNGMASGRTVSGFTQQDVAGIRAAAQGKGIFTTSSLEPVEACGLCHLGNDPIYALPDWHPPKYKTNPRVCLECHTVNGQ